MIIVWLVRECSGFFRRRQKLLVQQHSFLEPWRSLMKIKFIFLCKGWFNIHYNQLIRTWYCLQIFMPKQEEKNFSLMSFVMMWKSNILTIVSYNLYMTKNLNQSYRPMNNKNYSKSKQLEPLLWTCADMRMKNMKLKLMGISKLWFISTVSLKLCITTLMKINVLMIKCMMKIIMVMKLKKKEIKMTIKDSAVKHQLLPN